MSKSSKSSGNSGHLECNTGFLPGMDIWKYKHSENRPESGLRGGQKKEIKPKNNLVKLCYMKANNAEHNYLSSKNEHGWVFSKHQFLYYIEA